MRVVINMMSTLKRLTGVGRYAAQLFAAIERASGPDELTAFPGGTLARLTRRAQQSQGLLPSNSRRGLLSTVSSAARSAARSTCNAALGAAFRSSSRRGRFDLYHEPNFIPFETQLPTVITVHDLSVPLHPEWHPADRVRHFESNFASALDRAQHIITDADCVRSELIQNYAVRPDRVSAIPIGLGDEFLEITAADVQSMRRELSLPQEYLLCVGTIEPRKNIDTLLTAFCDLPVSIRNRCPLVIAGGWGWKVQSTADRIRRSAIDGVIHVGFTPDTLLPALYAGARALLCPSHYEGFGLPPLEMLGVGGAVIASTAAAHCEVLGSHAHFVDAADVEGWRSAMTRSIADDGWLVDIRRGGAEHARQFTWNRCASATIATYRSILQPRQLAA